MTRRALFFIGALVFEAMIACSSKPAAVVGTGGGSGGGASGAGGDEAGAGDGGPADAGGPGADATIVAFDATLICFGSGGDGPCSRTQDAQVTFPATGTYSKILLHLTLTCPAGGCDPWDWMGSIDLVTTAGAGAPDAAPVETLTELGRFITPFGITAGVNAPPVWDIDVTELRPLLSGAVTVRAFIDTWVPQGNVAAYGAGWLLGATFEMTGGTPAQVPVSVTPIWVWTTTGKEPVGTVYGDPTQPISASLPPQTVTLPAGASSYGVRSTITGHGQANLDNCSEFCSKDHTWQVGTTPNTATVWRTDCASYPSSGTYQYARAGWCPGASVTPWDFDVTSQVGAGSSTVVEYSVTPYLNTCNGSAPDGGLCTGCAAGESCTYDGSDHTQPFYYVQSLLIGFL